MPEFSEASKEKLATCSHLLRVLFGRVIEVVDCTILEGHRGQELQDRYFAEGKSKVRWPDGAHNDRFSRAVDAAPYPILWPDPKLKTYAKDLARWYYFGGVVKGVASGLGISIRWGGDWDSDNVFNDQTFDDLPHFELTVKP